MEAAEEMHELLMEIDRESYSPGSLRQELQATCDSIDVTFSEDRQLSRYGFEIQPGHRHEKTGLMLSSEDGPENPMYSFRPSRAGFSALREIAEAAGYSTVVSIGPHATEYVTSTDAHKYLTTEVDSDISGAPHLSYLTVEACAELLEEFFNPQLATDTWDTEQ